MQLKNLQSYIGVKIVQACEMTAQHFDKYHRKLDFLSEADRVGEPIPGHLVVSQDGYISWSPAKAFQGTHRLITNQEKEIQDIPVPVDVPAFQGFALVGEEESEGGGEEVTVDSVTEDGGEDNA